LCFFFKPNDKNKPNDKGPITSIVLGAHVLGSKTQDKRSINCRNIILPIKLTIIQCLLSIISPIDHKIENEIFVMKKDCEFEHFDILKKIVIGIVRRHFVKIDAFGKQSFKV